MEYKYHVFISYNSNDISIVLDIANRLKDHEIKVWLDKWIIPPGTDVQEALEEGILNSSSVAIMVGTEDIDRWAEKELRTAIYQNVYHGKPAIIPVLLPNVANKPKIPPLLNDYSQVDMTEGVTEKSIDELVWGIIGGPPPVSLLKDNLGTILSTALALVELPINTYYFDDDRRHLDSTAISMIKRKLHVSSEIIARDAMVSAAKAENAYPRDILTLFVPLLVELRWGRGYDSALKIILRIPESSFKVGDFDCREATPPCSINTGMLNAERIGTNLVNIRIDGIIAASIVNLNDEESISITTSINRYGRLGIAEEGSLSILERIKAIEVCAKPPEKMDKMLEALYRNRDVLIPILARRGIPDEKYKWLLAQEEAYPVQAELTELKDVSLNEETNTTRVPRCQLHTEVSEVEEIPVRDAFRSKSQMMPFDPALIKYLMQQFGGAKNNN